MHSAATKEEEDKGEERKANSNFLIYKYRYKNAGYAVAQLVEALRYKPEGRGFDSRSSQWDFSVT